MKRMATICLALAAALSAATLRADSFNNLFRVIAPRGECQIRLPGEEAYAPMLKGKAYPFGSTVRTGKESDVVIALSDKDALRLSANTLVAMNIDHANGDCRMIGLRDGEILMRLNVVNTNQFVMVDTPVARGVSMIGNVRFKLSSTQLEHNLEVRAEASSSIKIAGPQFVMPDLKSGNGILISSLKDNSMTRISDLLGDYKVYVNKGLEFNPDTSDLDGSESLLPVAMSSRSTVKIWRERAPVGGRLIVSVLATGPDGKGRESYAFAVGRDNVVTRSNVFDMPVATSDDEDDDTGAAGGDDADLFGEPAAGGGDDGFGDADAGGAADDNNGGGDNGGDNALDDFLF